MEHLRKRVNLSGFEVIEGLASGKIPAPQITDSFPLEINSWSKGRGNSLNQIGNQIFEPQQHGTWRLDVRCSGQRHVFGWFNTFCPPLRPF